MPNTEPLEKVIVDKILKALRARGGYWVKTHGSPFSANQPDIVGCYHGLYIGLEVKRPSTVAQVTDGQWKTLMDVIGAGGVSGVVTSVKEAESIMDEVEVRMQNQYDRGV